MAEAEFRDGKVFVKRTETERLPLIQRLSRIEGQVRGLRLMLEDDRYCGDELQQIKAMIAGLRGVARLLTEQHLYTALELDRHPEARTISEDVSRVLREVLKV